MFESGGTNDLKSNHGYKLTALESSRDGSLDSSVDSSVLSSVLSSWLCNLLEIQFSLDRKNSKTSLVSS